MQYTMTDLRAAFGAAADGRSDQELLSAYAQANKLDPASAAQMFNYNPNTSGKWGQRWRASGDSFVADMYGIGEAFGSESAKRGRIENEFDANVARGRAHELGAVQRWDDVHGAGDFADFAGGLLVDSAPTMATIAATGLTGGAAAPLAAARFGVQGAAGLARAASIGSRVGAFAGGYTAALGDTLQNQRDESGHTDLGTAGLAAVPYALVDTFTGAGGKLNRGLRRMAGHEAVEGAETVAGQQARQAIGDSWEGWRGAAGRVGVNALETGIKEAVGETFQEMMNQSARMGVNPDAELFSDSAKERYKESAIGGGILGAMFGGGLGGWRRSAAWHDQQRADEQAAQDAQRAAAQAQTAALHAQAQAEADTLARKEQDLLQSYSPKAGEQLGLFGSPDAAPLDNSDYVAPQPSYEDLVARRAALREEITNTIRQAGDAPHMVHTRLDELVAQHRALSDQLEPYELHAASQYESNPQMPLDFNRDARIDPWQVEMFPQSGGAVSMEAPQEESAPPVRDDYTHDWVNAPGELRSQITQRTQQRPSAFTVKTSIALAPLLHDTASARAYLDAEQANLDKEFNKLDRKVSGASNTISPEDYAQKRAVLEAKANDLIAARDVVDQHTRANTQRMAEAGLARARPGVSVGEQLRPDNAASVEAAMGPTIQAANAQVRQDTAATDARVQQRALDDTASERESVIREAMNQPYTGSPLTVARAALKAAGFNAFNPNAKEVELVNALHEQKQAQAQRTDAKRADVAAAVVQPPSLAYANGNFTPRSNLEGVANGTQASEAQQAETQGQQAPSLPGAAASQVGEGAPRQRTDKQQREDFARATGATLDLHGRQNRPAVRAAAAGDFEGVLSALEKSKNRLIAEIARRARGLNTKVAVSDDARETYIGHNAAAQQHSIDGAKTHLSALEQIRALAPVVAALPAGTRHVMYHAASKLGRATPSFSEFEGGVEKKGHGSLEYLARQGHTTITLLHDAPRTLDTKEDFAAFHKAFEAATQEYGEDTLRLLSTASAETAGVLGSYHPASDTVLVQDTPWQSEGVLAHEIVHAQVLKAVANPSAAQKPAVQRLERLYAHVRAELAPTGRNHYGLTSVQEFIAEGLTNPRFQYELNRIGYESRSAWDEFVKLIASLVGVRPDSAFTELLSIYSELTPQQKDSNVSVPNVSGLDARGSSVARGADTQGSVADSGRVADAGVASSVLPAGVDTDASQVGTRNDGAQPVDGGAVSEPPRRGRPTNASKNEKAALETVAGLRAEYNSLMGAPRTNEVQRRQHEQRVREVADTIQAFALDPDESPKVRAAAVEALNDVVDKHLSDPSLHAGMPGVRPRMDVSAGAVTPDSALMKKLAGARTLADALRVVLAHSTNQADKALARALLQLKGMEKISFTTSAPALPNAYGFYDPSRRAVTLMGTGDVQTLLHEAVHGGTLAALYNGHIDPKTGKPISALGRELVKLYEQTRQRSNGEYGFTNVDEFLAEAFTNPKFQEALRNDGLWSRFVQWVGKVLGVPKMAMNSLEKTLAIGEQLMRENDAAMNREEAASGVRYSEAGAPVAKAVRDEHGQPMFVGRKYALAAAVPMEVLERIPSEGEQILNFAVMPHDKFDVFGYVILLTDANGVPKELLDIQANDRRQGIGREVIETLLGAYPNNDLHISNIVQAARGFWERMGVPQQNLEDGAAYDGTLNWNTYSHARAGTIDWQGYEPGTTSSTQSQPVEAGSRPSGRNDSAATPRASETSEAGISTGSGLRGPAYRLNDTASAFSLPEPKRFGRGEHMLKSVVAALTDWRNAPGVLGLLSRRQLADRFRESSHMREYDAAESAREVMANEWVNITHKHAALWEKLPAKQGVELGRVMMESGYEGVHADLPFEHARNAHLRVGTDAEVREARATHARLHARLEALGNESPTAKKLYSDVKADMQRQWDELAKIKLDAIIDAYVPELGFIGRDKLHELVRKPDTVGRELKAQLKAQGSSAAVNRAMSKLIQDAAEHFQVVAQLQGPYFPFVRNGDHVVVLKSKSYTAAQAQFAQARDALQAVMHEDAPASGSNEAAEKAYEARLIAARKQVQSAREVLNSLKNDDQHYAVSFFERHWEAQNYLDDLNKNIAGSSSKDTLTASLETRAQYVQALDQVPGAFMRKVEDAMRRNLPAAQHAALGAALRDLHLTSLPDRSAMKSELKRMNVRGVRPEEMIRGYATRSIGNAFRASRMKYGDKINTAVESLRDSQNRDEVLLGDELAKRIANGIITPERNAFTSAISTASQVSHLWHLGMSPAYWLMNSAQPWVISLPIIAAHHGASRSAAALWQATKDVAEVARIMQKELKEELKGDALAGWKSLQIEVDPQRLGKTDGERKMLRELFNNGLLAINVKHDLATMSAGEKAGWIAKAAEFSSAPANMVEVVNRVATALAAYRLEVGRGAKPDMHDSATGFASRVVADTHFDYSEDNAPRLMRAASLGGLGRLLFQFKKYTQAIIYLQAKLFSDGKLHKLLASGNTPEDVAQARRAFLYLNGMTLAMAGGAGLLTAPLVAIIAKSIQSMYPDDDEPDFGQMVYNGLSDVNPALARAAFHGVPAAFGVNLSKTLGMGSAVNPFAFTDTQKDGKDLFANMLLGLAGPAAGLMANWFEAASVGSSNPGKAAQLAAPRAIRNVLQALDRARSDDPTTVQQEGGVTTRSGVPVLKNDEVDLWDTLVKGIGFEPTHVGERYDARSAQLNKEKALGDVRKQLLSAWNPKDGMTQEIRDFNARNPNGRITYQDLLKSHREQMRVQRETVNGVRFNRKRTPDVEDQLTF